MADALTRKRWTIAGLFLGVGVTSWLGSMGVARVGGHYLALPEGASLVALDVQEAAPATPRTKPTPGNRGLGKPSNDVAAGGPPEGGPLPAGGPDDPSSTEGLGGSDILAPSTNRSRPFPGGPPAAGSKSAYVEPILARNIFDSSRVGMAAVEGDEISGGEHKTDLKVVLLATVVTEPAEYSSALITEEKSGRAGAQGYGIDDDLLGEAKIIRIEQRKVYIRRSDGDIEYLAMDPDKVVAAGEAAGGETETAGVSKADDTHFVIEQALIDEMLANPEKLYSQIRAVPHKDASGEIDGYRLSGIRKKSVFGKLGVKNGDVVHAVNGKTLTSMSAGMEAFNSLQNEKSFNFEITRRNQRQTFEYEIR